MNSDLLKRLNSNSNKNRLSSQPCCRPFRRGGQIEAQWKSWNFGSNFFWIVVVLSFWERILWLARVSQVAWKYNKTPRDWQTGVVILIFKKGDCKQCRNYRGISLLSLPGKAHAKYLGRKSQKVAESKLEDGQCGFRPSSSTTDQIFTLKQIFEKSWENGKNLCNLCRSWKTYDRVPRDKLWKVLQEYGVDGQLIVRRH